MSKAKQQFLDLFLNPERPVQTYAAEVLSVAERTCNVRLLASDLEIEGVRLLADPDAEDYVLLTPRVGSNVLISAVENEIAEAFVVSFSQLSRMEAKIDNTAIVADKGKVEIVQGEMVLRLMDNKVEVSNSTTSLKKLFDDLADILQNLKVITAQGTSTALTPDTIAKLTAFKATYPQLLG